MFQWGEALRDDTKNGCVADYDSVYNTIQYNVLYFERVDIHD